MSLRGLRRAVVAIVAMALLAGACGDSNGRELTGVVLRVEARSLTDIESFMLKSGDETLEIFIDPDANYAFPPSHLSEHVLSGAPVRVEVEERGDRLYAVELDDA